MAADMFMQIDDIKGESTDASHKDEIEVLSFGWATKQSGSAHSGTGAGSGKVSVGDLSFTKYVDRSSPVLFKLCCNGKHFQAAQLTIRKAGGPSQSST
jgi:type VI secretion system secreted protein Hcp